MQTPFHMSESSDRIWLISSLGTFKLACNIKEVIGDATIALFHFFMTSSLAAALNARPFLALTSSSTMNGAKRWMLRTYPQEVCYLLLTYALESEIANADATPARCAQPTGYIASSLRGSVCHSTAKTRSIFRWVCAEIYSYPRALNVRPSQYAIIVEYAYRGDQVRLGSSRDVIERSTEGNWCIFRWRAGSFWKLEEPQW